MIKIQKADEVEEAFFNGRDFGDSIQTVADVLKDVQLRKDAALHEYSTKFDLSSPSSFEIPQAELKAAALKMEKENPELYKSLCYSRDLALRFAKKQKESFDDFEVELEDGLFTGQKNIAVEKAGVYVPAGRFPLVSTVVMTVTPAVAAGVKEIILCTPPRVHPDDKKAAQEQGLGIPGKPFAGGKPYADENIMAAAYICGVTKAYAVGGSQAVAAMAFGTQSVPKTDVIVGPGNKFVAEAKKLVYGTGCRGLACAGRTRCRRAAGARNPGRKPCKAGCKANRKTACRFADGTNRLQKHRKLRAHNHNKIFGAGGGACKQKSTGAPGACHGRRRAKGQNPRPCAQLRLAFYRARSGGSLRRLRGRPEPHVADFRKRPLYRRTFCPGVLKNRNDAKDCRQKRRRHLFCKGCRLPGGCRRFGCPRPRGPLTAY